MNRLVLATAAVISMLIYGAGFSQAENAPVSAGDSPSSEYTQGTSPSHGDTILAQVITVSDGGAPTVPDTAPVATTGPTDAGVATVVKLPTTPAEKVEQDPVGSAGELVGAIRSGQWRLVAALLLGFLMFALSKARDNTSWFRGDRGGAILVGILAVGGALSTSLLSSGPIDWRLFVGSLGVMWTAVGGYTWAKRLIWPQDKGGE